MSCAFGEHTHGNGYAVDGFDLVRLDFLEAIVSAAEAVRSPATLSLAEYHFEYYDFKLAMEGIYQFDMAA